MIPVVALLCHGATHSLDICGQRWEIQRGKSCFGFIEENKWQNWYVPLLLYCIDSPDDQLGVVTVAGLYRTGKSYILNRLLNRQV